MNFYFLLLKAKGVSIELTLPLFANQVNSHKGFFRTGDHACIIGMGCRFWHFLNLIVNLAQVGKHDEFYLNAM